MSNEWQKTLKDNEYEICSLKELLENDRIITEINGREIAVFSKNGEYYAVANYCPHQAGPLCEGPITGTITADEDMNWQYSEEDLLVTCPWHYWKFDVSTGKSVKDERYKVPTYDVEIRQEKVIVKV